MCCRRNASSRCFSAGPLITFQWKDFFQTCLSPRNSSSNDDSKDPLLDASKRPCTNWREKKRPVTRASYEDKRGKVEEQVAFPVDSLYPKIADSVKPIRKKAEYLDRSQEQKNRLV